MNTASRMESTGAAGAVHMSAETAALLGIPLKMLESRVVDVKGACRACCPALRALTRRAVPRCMRSTGRGRMDTFLLEGCCANADEVQRHLGPPLPTREV